MLAQKLKKLEKKLGKIAKHFKCQGLFNRQYYLQVLGFKFYIKTIQRVAVIPQLFFSLKQNKNLKKILKNKERFVKIEKAAMFFF